MLTTTDITAATRRPTPSSFVAGERAGTVRCLVPVHVSVNESIGYATYSLEEPDLTAQRGTLLGLGVADERIHLDHGLTDSNRDRPGLAQALAAVRAGEAKGKLRGKQLKLTVRRQTHLLKEHRSGEHTIADLAEPFSASRATVYRVLERHRTSVAPSTSAGK